MVLVLVDRLQLRRSQFRDDIGHRVDLFRVVPFQLLVELVRVHRNRQDVRIHHETQRLRGLVIQRRTHRQIIAVGLVEAPADIMRPAHFLPPGIFRRSQYSQKSDQAA